MTLIRSPSSSRTSHDAASERTTSRSPWTSAMTLICTAIGYVLLISCAGSGGNVAHRIEGQVWSPYCPGRLLIDCPTKQADDLRAEISRRLAAGQSADDVMRWIRLNFGNEAIARPSGRDTMLIWSFP